MKVCVISAIFPPEARGGAERVAYATALAWPEDDVFVISATPYASYRRRSGELATLETPRGLLRTYRLAPLNLFSVFRLAEHGTLARLIWHVLDMVNPHTYLAVRRILSREQPDVVLTHNLKGLGYTVPAAIRHARCRGRPVRWLHTIHDFGAIHPTGLKIYGQETSWWQTMPLVRLYARINRQLFGSPDVVISPSSFLLREYRAAGFFPASTAAVVRNPVIGSAATPNRAAALRFLYQGQLEPYKGLGFLLEAWETFARRHSGAELVVWGEGSLRAAVERAARDLPGVRYRPDLDVEAADQLFGEAQFAVLPSVAYENSPVTIAKSFTAGTPVVASRIGGIPELVGDGRNGFLCPPGSAADLLEALERAAAADWGRLHAAALALAPEFSLERYREQVQSLIVSSP